MIKAVESADSFTAGDTVETGTGITVAITTRAATPIDTVIRVAVRRTFPTPSATASAPTRPMCFALLHRRSSIVVPPSELSGAPLQSRRSPWPRGSIGTTGVAVR